MTRRWPGMGDPDDEAPPDRGADTGITDGGAHDDLPLPRRERRRPYQGRHRREDAEEPVAPDPNGDRP